MSAKEVFFSRKNRAAQALQAAQILFPSSSAASPVDNSVQAIFERLKLSADSDSVGAGYHYDGLDIQGKEEEAIDKQGVLKRAAERGLDMLEIIQDWLVMEVDKVESGSTSTDCKLRSDESLRPLTTLFACPSLAEYPATSPRPAYHSARCRIPTSTHSQGSL